MVPAALQDLLDAALDAVGGDPRHDLPAIHRLRIYRYVGSSNYLRGRWRHGQLAIAAAERALPVWRAARPDDPRAERLLDTARECLRADDLPDALAESAYKRGVDAWQWLMKILDRHRYLAGARRSEMIARLKPLEEDAPDRALWALAAVVVAVWAAAGGDWGDWWGATDSRMGPRDADPITNETLWDMADAARWAAFAVAGDPREGESDDAARLGYWRWWLAEAVPAAWASRQFARPFAALDDCLTAVVGVREQLALIAEELRALLEDERDLQRKMEETASRVALLEQHRRDVADMVGLLTELPRHIASAQEYGLHGP